MLTLYNMNQWSDSTEGSNIGSTLRECLFLEGWQSQTGSSAEQPQSSAERAPFGGASWRVTFAQAAQPASRACHVAGKEGREGPELPPMLRSTLTLAIILATVSVSGHFFQRASVDYN